MTAPRHVPVFGVAADQTGMMEPPTHLVRCASHRARARLFGTIGRKPQAYWHWQKGSVYGVYGVSDVELPRARSVKGVSRVRGDTAEWSICWR